MSINVYIGHSGERLVLDPSNISTLDSLKSWVHQRASIPPRTQVLLTAQGKQVRTQTLVTENEVFVFDSSRFNAGASPSSSELAHTSGSEFNPGTPPDTISSQNDLQAWQNLFRARRNWAGGLLHGCEASARQVQKYQDEQAIIERSLGVAVASLQQHIKSAEQKYLAIEARSEGLLQEQERHTADWEANLDCLRSIPARSEFTRFVQPPSPINRRLSQQGNITTLQGFVDVAGVKRTGQSSRSRMASFAEKVIKLREDLETATNSSDELLRAVDQISARSTASNGSEAGQLLDEIEMVVKKMASDLEHVQSLPRVAQSVSQASKMALLHTRNYLPNLSEYCSEMNDVVQRARQQRDNAAETALEHMRTLSSIESVLAHIYQDSKGIEYPKEEEEAATALNTVSRLPSVYGALLVESVRRREWVAKMRRDAGTLQEEVATYQDEEDKRRKKWVRSVEDVVKAEALRSSVLGIELSLQNEGGSWPMVTRDELAEYLKVLTDIYGPCPVTEELDQSIKDLDKPTRKQIKHAKAFKNGSMHEAVFGDTSLLLRGDDQHKALRESHIRLEEELKGQKSRVRKLEDLLHRQTHIGRATSGQMFTPQSESTRDRINTPNLAIATPPSDDLPRNDSLKLRRPSSAQAQEEKRLARRIVDLEAELQAAKDEATSRKDSDVEVQNQVEEAISTKKDLMENMEAQQREFASERRALEKDLAEARERIEEVENELERLVGSREDERHGIDARISAFEEEIARLKEDAMGHAARAATAQDAKSSLERKLDIAENARAEAEAQLQKSRIEREERQEAESEQLQVLATAHAHLAPDAEPPNGLVPISVALEELARKSTTHVKDLAEAVAFAKSENESLSSINERHKNELQTATEKQGEIEDELRQTQERLSAEEARSKSLEQQLAEEHEQLRILRSKFADGETGSEVLRQRVAEEEGRAGKLAFQLAETKSHVNSLDVEIMRLQKKHSAYSTAAEAAKERLQKRAERAKDVSQRLYSQNSRLSRLLERLGFAIAYQENTMVLERASRMAGSISMDDPRSQLSRVSSAVSPPPSNHRSLATEDTSDVSIVRWPEAETAEDEAAQFEAFSQQISRFNVDVFGEAVVKRLRDFEYTARKYNKEAKESAKRAEGYKERSVKLKGDAQAKIAVKDFKEGDLALFLPTRGQAKGAWAAFNIGCPHYFLAEKDGMRLGTRDYIVARISKIEQKVVDLSKTVPQSADGRSIDEASSAAPSFEDDNPFELSDGLMWWMVHATEERGAGGAPTTPGLGKSTAAVANVDAKGSIRIKRNSKSDDASKHLNKSLDSRRSSSTSKKGAAGTLVQTLTSAGASPVVGSKLEAAAGRQRSESQASSLRPLPAPATAGDGAGLGIATTAPPPAASSAAPPAQTDQIRKASTTAPNPNSREASSSRAQQRSKSPSKSIRSLQRNLETQSPGKSPAKKQAWESLWSAEFSLESPSKSGK